MVNTLRFFSAIWDASGSIDTSISVIRLDYMFGKQELELEIDVAENRLQVLPRTPRHFAKIFNEGFPFFSKECHNQKCDFKYCVLTYAFTVIRCKIPKLTPAFRIFEYKDNNVQLCFADGITRVTQKDPYKAKLQLDIDWEKVKSDGILHKVDTILTFE